jgi:hypothetical protein
MTSDASEGSWDMLRQRCESRGLSGDAMFAEVLQTVTKSRTRGALPPLPPIRQTPPLPGEVVEYPLSEPEFVELAVGGGTTKVWQIVRYDEPHLALVPAVIYLNGFSLVWDDAGIPAEFADGEPVTPEIEDVVILDGPTVFGGVLVCRAGRPDAVAWIRHDQLLIEPRL